MTIPIPALALRTAPGGALSIECLLAKVERLSGWLSKGDPVKHEVVASFKCLREAVNGAGAVQDALHHVDRCVPRLHAGPIPRLLKSAVQQLHVELHEPAEERE
jgi:hypothetical protein